MNLFSLQKCIFCIYSWNSVQCVDKQEFCQHGILCNSDFTKENCPKTCDTCGMEETPPTACVGTGTLFICIALNHLTKDFIIFHQSFQILCNWSFIFSCKDERYCNDIPFESCSIDQVKVDCPKHCGICTDGKDFPNSLYQQLFS